MLNEKQLRSLDKLEALTKEELKKFVNDERPPANRDYQMLKNVAGWLENARKHHANPHFKSGLESILENLREVARHFRFDLKE